MYIRIRKSPADSFPFHAIAELVLESAQFGAKFGIKSRTSPYSKCSEGQTIFAYFTWRDDLDVLQDGAPTAWSEYLPVYASK